MKEIKSYKTVLFIAGIFVLLSPVMFYAPDEGWEFGGVKMKFLTMENFVHPKTQENADISDLLIAVDTNMNTVIDPLVTHQNGSNGTVGAPNGGELSEDASTELQMTDVGKINLHTFFQTLSSVAADKKKISILHYGDSQIEGDRMTSYIRQRIQDQFGGNGPGLIPATNVYNTF
ncbi:MAG: hypothetical protein JKY09_03955, partial [Crocinitomicaceae bacterium]|nr:hypothetical protein [Crocinitomicaceae bacterium]